MSSVTSERDFGVSGCAGRRPLPVELRVVDWAVAEPPLGGA